MNDFMQLLYEYVQKQCVCRYLDAKAYELAGKMEERHRSALCRTLDAEQAAIFKKYQFALEELRDLELAAMFNAAWRAAREL